MHNQTDKKYPVLKKKNVTCRKKQITLRNIFRIARRVS